MGASTAAHVEAVNDRFHFRKLNVDPWQAELLIERLQRFHGIRAAERFTFSTASKSHLAATLLQTIRAGALHLYPAEGLREELLGLRLVPLAGRAGFGFDHVRGKHDDAAVALALAMVAAGSAPSGEGRSISLLDDGSNVPVTHCGDLTLVGERYRDAPTPTYQPHLHHWGRTMFDDLDDDALTSRMNRARNAAEAASMPGRRFARRGPAAGPGEERSCSTRVLNLVDNDSQLGRVPA